jgi:hypothetical protein
MHLVSPPGAKEELNVAADERQAFSHIREVRAENRFPLFLKML